MNTIIGIDPGTTAAYAVLDMKGNLLKLHSSRGLDLRQLIRETIELGSIIAATDRKECPAFIRKFAAATGARIISPEEDMLNQEKKVLVDGYEFGNAHEMDALSAAAYALKKIKMLVRKIEKFLEQEKGIDEWIKKDKRFAERVEREVMLKNISIKKAIENIKRKIELSMIEEKERQLREKEMIKVRAIDENKTSPENIKWMKDRITALINENEILSTYNRKLKKNIRNLMKKISKIKSISEEKESHIEKNIEKKLMQKENRTSFLQNELDKKSQEIAALKEKIKELNDFISESGQKVLIKKLENLGWDEKKLKWLNIQQNDILLVEEPNIYSEKTLDYLKDKVFVILFRKKPGTAIAKKFTFIDAGQIELKEDEDFALASHSDIEKEKSAQNVFKRIIEEYKRERVT